MGRSTFRSRGKERRRLVEGAARWDGSGPGVPALKNSKRRRVLPLQRHERPARGIQVVPRTFVRPESKDSGRFLRQAVGKRERPNEGRLLIADWPLLLLTIVSAL